MPGCKYLFLDFETFSSVDIAGAGSFRYMESPDFEILLTAFAIDDEPVVDFESIAAEQPLEPIWDLLLDPSVIKVAHNTAFERAAIRRVSGEYMPPEQWIDTMILAAYNGLPMSLDSAGAALSLERQKIKEGTSLINYFCKPCRPTGANGGRTRNLPEHAPDKWARFKDYCVRDVDVERELFKRLNCSVPEWERKVFSLDARINEHGVQIDRELVEAAVAVDKQSREASTQELRLITGLENPNSTVQLKSWLETVGVESESLDKATVSELIATTQGRANQALRLRQQLCKTSTKKYDAMLAAASPADDRIRGMMQYYGAGRTGRWAGRIVQPQNLPQNHLADIAEVRELVRGKDLETLQMCFESTADTLSQLIRTALIPAPGHTFLVADYSAIEARVIAYLSGEKWRQDTFAAGGDIYCASASSMFKVPVEKHGVNGHLRQKGKVAELACIAEGSLVLTERGLVPIEEVSRLDKVWDGLEWVAHEGVAYRGIKEVIKYGGLEATADHPVWTEDRGQFRCIPFGCAASRGARLAMSQHRGKAIRVGNDYLTGKTLERKDESLQSLGQVQRLRSRKMGKLWKPAKRKVQGLPELLAAESGAKMARQTIHSGETAMREPERRRLQKLRSEGHSVLFRQRPGCLPLHDRNLRSTGQEPGDRQNRCERKLCSGQSKMGYTSGKLPESKKVFKRVYDIVNAGPRHRFTVSGVLVHNCGYGGGVAALKAFGADKMGLTEEEMQDIVRQWRKASPTIPAFWREAEQQAIGALNTPGRAFGLKCGVRYRRDADALRCRLPSGRVLSYWAADYNPDEGRIEFMAQNQTTRKWEKSQTWGGKLVENIVQAFARDCLAWAMLRLDRAGYKICFSVHDELIAEEPKGSRTWQDMAEIMGQPLPWAPGLLLRADGYSTDFYMKD